LAKYTKAASPPDTAPPAAAALTSQGELLRCSSRVIAPSLRPVALAVYALL